MEAGNSRGIEIATQGNSRESTTGDIRGRYNQLESYRSGFVDRGREVSKLTIPYLLPQNRNNDQSFPTPYQSLGSEGTNGMANKLLLALFPPNEPFFRYFVMDDALAANLDDPQMVEQRKVIADAISKAERVVLEAIEASADRDSLAYALKHLLVAGNCLLHKPEWDKPLRVFPIDQYVTRRSPKGTMLETIVKEDVSLMDLDESTVEEAGLTQDEKDASNSSKTYELYTRIMLVDDNMYEITQELNGKLLDNKATEPKDSLSWIPLRRTRVEGEAYGHGYIEEYFGDLQQVDKMYKAQVEGAALAARTIFLSKPSGQTKASNVAKAVNGDIIDGNIDDIGVLRVDKLADFQWVSNVIDRLENRLSRAFLMTQSIQRSGERVTAEEIRTLAKDLEDQLGGLYSILAQELQRPYLNTIIASLKRAGKLPKWPKNLIEPVITTGLEALGRGEDLQKLQIFTQAIGQLNPEVLQTYMRMDIYISKIAQSLGIDTEDLIKSEEEVMQQQQAQQQAAMQQMMLEKMGPEAVKQAGPEIKEAITEGE